MEEKRKKAPSLRESTVGGVGPLSGVSWTDLLCVRTPMVLYELIKAGLLFINALAVLDDRRFLNKCKSHAHSRCRQDPSR